MRPSTRSRTPWLLVPAGAIVAAACSTSPGQRPSLASQGLLAPSEADVSAAATPSSEAPAASVAAGPDPSAIPPVASASAPTPSSSTSPDPAPPPDTRVADACKKLCEEVKKSCKKKAVRRCEARCQGYEQRSKGCEEAFVGAIGCQARSHTGLCSSIIGASCADEFAAMKRCERGEETVPLAKRAPLPDGWKRFTDDSWKIAFGLPPDAALAKDAKVRTWRGTHDGLTYEVFALPRPTKMTTTSIIKLLLGHLGFRCQKGMRLHGRVDGDDDTFLLFETGCHGGDLWTGQLHILADRTIVLTSHGDRAGIAEPFHESFERLEE